MYLQKRSGKRLADARHVLPDRQTLPCYRGSNGQETMAIPGEPAFSPWHGACDHWADDKGFAGSPPVSLNGILSTALSALQTNTTALGVVSQNISNLNTTGYADRVVNEQTQVLGGNLSGVDIADIQRVTNQFLTEEALSANSSSQQYSTEFEHLLPVERIIGPAGREHVAYFPARCRVDRAQQCVSVAQFGDQPAVGADGVPESRFDGFRSFVFDQRPAGSGRSAGHSDDGLGQLAAATDLFAQPADPDGAGAGQHLVRPSRSARPGSPEPLAIYGAANERSG